MKRLTPYEKDVITERIKAFPESGLPTKPSPSTGRYYGSFHGRDFKVLAQMFLFVAWDYLTSPEKEVWLSLSKVGTFMYMNFYCPNENNIRGPPNTISITIHTQYNRYFKLHTVSTLIHGQLKRHRGYATTLC